MIPLQNITDYYLDITRQYNEYEIDIEEKFYSQSTLRKLVLTILDNEAFNAWIDSIEEYERTTNAEV